MANCDTNAVTTILKRSGRPAERQGRFKFPQGNFVKATFQSDLMKTLEAFTPLGISIGTAGLTDRLLHRIHDHGPTLTIRR